MIQKKYYNKYQQVIPSFTLFFVQALLDYPGAV